MSFSCTLQIAIDIARRCEDIAPRFGFHIAITGGCLYKYGTRKDIDILFYKHCSPETVLDKSGLLDELERTLGLEIGDDFGRVVKTIYNGLVVDLLFPGFEGVYDEPHKEQL